MMKKCMLGKRLIVASMATAMLLGECVSTMGSVFSESEENVYVYFSNGSYKVITDIVSGASAEIAAGMDVGDYASAKFSPDGKYLYYMKQCHAGVGNLWRCEYHKLKPGSSDNETYCQFVALDVKYDSFVVTQTGVTFKDDNNNLYYFNGSSIRKIGQDVNGFVCSKDGTQIVFGSSANPSVYSEYKDFDLGSVLGLYGVETSNLDEVVTLANEYLEVFDITDFDNIFFTKESYKEDQPYIYVTNLKTGPRYLGTLVDRMRKPENGTVYYRKGTEIDWTLEELFTDSSGETEKLEQLRESLPMLKEEGYIEDLYAYKNGEEKRIDILPDWSRYLGHILYYDTIKCLLPYDISMDGDEVNRYLEKHGSYIISPYINEPLYIDMEGYWILFNEHDIPMDGIYLNEHNMLIDGWKNVILVDFVDGQFAAIDSLSRHASVVAIDESAIYYEIDSEDEESNRCNVYKISGEDTTCVAENVPFDVIYLYSDGSVLANDDEDIMVLNRNGKQYEIAGNVTDYVYGIESTILYISDDKLYVWQGENSELLAQDVERVWCKDSLEQVHYLGNPDTDD